MRLEVVYLGLLVMTQIADTECPCSSGIPVDGQLLAEVGGTDKGGGYHIMVVVALTKNLVVGLSVVGTEHDAYEWQVQFVSQGEMLFP